MAADFWGGVKNWWGDVTGGNQKTAGEANQAAALTQGQTAVDQSGAGTNAAIENINQASQATGQAAGLSAQQAGEAAGMGKGYDTGAKESMGKNAADYMQKANAAAQGQASQAGQAAATAGARSAAQAARASGVNKGQAALAGAQQAGDIYSQTYQQGLESGRGQYSNAAQQFAGQGQEMANRQLSARGQELGAYGQQGNLAGQTGTLSQGQGALGLQNAALTSGVGSDQYSQGQEQNQGLWNAVGSVSGAVGGLISSDKRLKKDIKSTPEMLDAIVAKLKGKSFEYKDEVGDPGPQIGVMAQDLEQTPLAPVVEETPAGKEINTDKLSTANLDLILEMARRIHDLEAKVGGK
jgi:hypothetical protein